LAAGFGGLAPVAPPLAAALPGAIFSICRSRSCSDRVIIIPMNLESFSSSVSFGSRRKAKSLGTVPVA
jgi:hypothetical protein